MSSQILKNMLHNVPMPRNMHIPRSSVMPGLKAAKNVKPKNIGSNSTRFASPVIKDTFGKLEGVGSKIGPSPMRTQTHQAKRALTLAVEAGDVMEHQARTALDSLESGKLKPGQLLKQIAQVRQNRQAKLDSVRNQLTKAVKTKLLTQEQADKAYKKVCARRLHPNDLLMDLQTRQAKRALKRAVKAGDVMKHQARTALDSLESGKLKPGQLLKQIAQVRQNRQAKLDTVRNQLTKAVKTKLLTQEQADKAYGKVCAGLLHPNDLLMDLQTR